MPFVQANDLKIHYLEAGAGVPVVFVHGNWGTSSWWEPALARLPAGFRGLAPDVRGRGKTAGPAGDHSLGGLAGDLLAFADALGLERFHLIGHSLGAGIALQAALDHQARLLTLTVIAPPWPDGMPAELNQPDRQRLLKEQPEFFDLALKLMAPTAPDDDYWRRLVEEGRAQPIEVALASLDALSAWRPGATLGTITIPRLVIGGALDQLVSPEVVERAAMALNTGAIILEGIGHSVNVEAPDLLMHLLSKHLRQDAP